MEKFKIPHGGKDSDSINRTIRWQGDIYDMLMDLSDRYKISFNRLANECVRFALNNIEEDSPQGD